MWKVIGRIKFGLSLVNECVNNPSVPGALSKRPSGIFFPYIRKKNGVDYKAKLKVSRL
jgi:hypothetical protein